ncbi:NAD-dependent epimerase/dehydratase family protein [Clostridium tarantellae]|uniref:NAD-dependent epimerase/dehydratase family protein n=1 Tax=Clostridium tarantellae TaxID=39493 RepID=UPI00128AE5B0|nr:NAD(P)-dependent oxidoreductase [Clostridium tarantellae]
MRILITGAGGWLGSELTKQLLEQGEKIKALVLVVNEKLKNLKKFFGSNLEIIEGDICDKKIIIKSLDNVDLVYHLAAKVHFIPKNENDEEMFYKINTYATEQLFNLCLEKKVKRIIFYSSVSVYEQSKEEINVDSPKRSNTAYGKSKLMAEKIGLRLIKEKGLPLTIIEPVTVYGGEDLGNFEKLRLLINKGLMIRFGDGENKKTVIYYKDLISLTLKIATDEKYLGKVIICGTEIISLNEIISILIHSSHKKVRLFKINKFLTNFIIKLLQLVNTSITRKLSNQIKTLSFTNKYNIDVTQGLIEDFTTFRKYYSKEIEK